MEVISREDAPRGKLLSLMLLLVTEGTDLVGEANGLSGRLWSTPLLEKKCQEAFNLKMVKAWR